MNNRTRAHVSWALVLSGWAFVSADISAQRSSAPAPRGSVETVGQLLEQAQDLFQQKRNQAAQKAAEDALAMARRLGEPTSEASALGMLVAIYSAAGDSSRAITSGFGSLTIAAGIPNPQLCETAHGDLVAVYGREINRLNVQYGSLGNSRSFARAHELGSTIIAALKSLGEPEKLAVALAAESELYRAEGKRLESVQTLSNALDAATRGGAYNMLPKLQDLTTKHIALVAAVAAEGTGVKGLSEAFVGLDAKSKAELVDAVSALSVSSVKARLVLNFTSGLKKRLDEAENASQVRDGLAIVDGLLQESQGSENYVGIAAITSVKARLTVKSTNYADSMKVSLDAIRNAVKSGKATMVWSVANAMVDSMNSLAGRRGASNSQMQTLQSAENSLRSELVGFVRTLTEQAREIERAARYHVS